MKKILFTLAALFMMQMTVNAQDVKTYEQLMKERKEIRKLNKAALKEKASKDARKEAKKLEKAGWKALAGRLPIVRQLDRSYNMQQEIDETMSPAWIIGTAISKGRSIDAAKLQANELARLNLAGNIQVEMAGLIENSIGNQQNDGEASSLVQTIGNSQTLINQNIKRTQTIAEMYRNLPDGTVEVQVSLAYSMNEAKAAVRQAVAEQLQQMTQEQKDRLQQVVGW